MFTFILGAILGIVVWDGFVPVSWKLWLASVIDRVRAMFGG